MQILTNYNKINSLISKFISIFLTCFKIVKSSKLGSHSGSGRTLHFVKHCPSMSKSHHIMDVVNSTFVSLCIWSKSAFCEILFIIYFLYYIESKRFILMLHLPWQKINAQYCHKVSK